MQHFLLQAVCVFSYGYISHRALHTWRFFWSLKVEKCSTLVHHCHCGTNTVLFLYVVQPLLHPKASTLHWIKHFQMQKQAIRNTSRDIPYHSNQSISNKWSQSILISKCVCVVPRLCSSVCMSVLGSSSVSVSASVSGSSAVGGEGCCGWLTDRTWILLPRSGASDPSSAAGPSMPEMQEIIHTNSYRARYWMQIKAWDFSRSI